MSKLTTLFGDELDQLREVFYLLICGVMVYACMNIISPLRFSYWLCVMVYVYAVAISFLRVRACVELNFLDGIYCSCLQSLQTSHLHSVVVVVVVVVMGV